MTLNRVSIVRPDLNIDTDYTTFFKRFTERRIVYERAAMGHTGFNYDVRFNAVYDFLNPDHVFGKLHDRPAQPRKRVRILFIPAHLYPEVGNDLKCLFAVKVQRTTFCSGLLGHRSQLSICLLYTSPSP